MNPYRILGISPLSNKTEIRAAYLKKAKELHPDSATGSDLKFKELHEAYMMIRNKPSNFTETTIDFSNLVKNVMRPASRHHSPKAQEPEKEFSSTSESSKSLHSIFCISLFLYLWCLDTKNTSLMNFQSTYIKDCNKIDYSNN